MSAAETQLLCDALAAIAALDPKTKSDHIGALKQARHIAKCALAAAKGGAS